MRNRSRTHLARSLGIALALVFAVVLSSCGPAAKVGNAVGDRAPDFALTDAEGRKVRLADFAGKVVVLNFWATWCPPCRREIPDFVQLQKQYGPKGVVVVGISLDDSWDPVRPFMTENAMNYPVLLGDRAVAETYDAAKAIPMTYVIDASGVIRTRHLGYGPAAVWQRAIDDAL
jgi:cytochrome c biogenesis protein CcmG/thiol:disulfide interchange protein DsbE